jgi:hypothetical protein
MVESAAWYALPWTSMRGPGTMRGLGGCLFIAEHLMAKITFHESASLGEGNIIRVRRGGLPFGKIYHSGGMYSYYKAGRQTLSGPDLENADLEELKVAMKARYGRRPAHSHEVV